MNTITRIGAFGALLFAAAGANATTLSGSYTVHANQNINSGLKVKTANYGDKSFQYKLFNKYGRSLYMAATLPAPILGLRGQCVKRVSWKEERGTLVFYCNRDRRFAPVDYRTGARGTVNRRLRREVLDMPICGQPVALDIEYCQLKVGAVDRRMERLDFAKPGCGHRSWLV